MTIRSIMTAASLCLVATAAVAQPTIGATPGQRAGATKNWKPVARTALTSVVSIARPIRSDRTDAPRHHCTGVALTRMHVLTSAACVTLTGKNNAPVPAIDFEILLGPKINAASEQWLVAEVTRHPDYDPIAKHADLAILRLTLPLPETIQPMALASSAPTGNATFSQASWMYDADDNIILSEMYIPTMERGQCEAAMRDDLVEKSQETYVELIRTLRIGPDAAAGAWRQLLAGLPKELLPARICVTTSEGFPCDTDNAAVLMSKTAAGPRLSGILSAMPECGVPGMPGVYTSLAAHLPWLQQTMAPQPAATDATGAQRQLPAAIAAARLAATGAGTEPGTQRAGERIVGGVAAVPGTYAFQVSLILAEAAPGDEFSGFYCGGTRIGERHVLTAAHCTVGTQAKPITAKDVEVYLGHDGFRGGERIPVRRIAVHPGWNTVTLANDIAIIELERAPSSTARSETIDLMKPGADYPQRARAIGWGATDFQGKASRHLRETPMSVVRQGACDQHYRAFETRSVRNIVGQVAQLMGLPRASEEKLVKAATEAAEPRIGETMLCAGSLVGARSTCQGDSGGPLFSQGADGKPTQIGVVSWGVACDTRDVYGVFTDVSKYADWIGQETK